jgi:hypothetical protein
MSDTLFRPVPFTVRQLVDNIRRGDVALPEIQRPFVWQNRKVRDLFDSMVKGFPVGYLLFWATGADGGARQIGTDSKDERIARWLIVDGQQRLTSLYSVLTGTAVVREDYTESRIRIAFRPHDCTFEVTDAAIEKDPEFLPDISPLFDDYKKTVRAFLERLQTARGPLAEEERDRLDDQFDRVRDVAAYPFQVIELDSALDEEQVADIFVRINSEGVPLNQADFILTLMSVFRDKARRQLEDFSRDAKQPTISKASPFNWYIQPQPDQLLRVAIAVAMRRAVLKHAYSMLRGKSLQTGEMSAEHREAQFDRLQRAQDHVLDLVNWHEFLQCIERAGFRSSKMLAGSNAVLYTYALWIIGRTEYGVPLGRLREVIARWFFMAHITARYSGSFESTFESDLAKLGGISSSDSEGFIDTLDHVVNDRLTNDYWAISLPNELATSASKSPALMGYLAALNIHDTDVLLSTTKVRSRLDPAVSLKKGIERHHLFPRNYLLQRGITDIKRVNQIANFAMVEWSDNIQISDDAPGEYWPKQLAAKRFDDDRLARQCDLHALPDGWQAMSYDQFLSARRVLMADVVRRAFEQLRSAEYTTPVSEPVSEGRVFVPADRGEISLFELVDNELVAPGTVLVAVLEEGEVSASVLPDGRIHFDEVTFSSLAELSDAVGLTDAPWHSWVAVLPDGRIRLAALREQLANSTGL